MSGASVSSLGSSNAASNNSAVDIAHITPGEDGELFEERNWMFKVFSVLYTLGKERPLTGPKYAFLRLFLNGLQLWLLVVIPHYGWDISPDTTIWRIVSFLRLGEFLSTYGYSFYLGVLYAFVALLGISVALSAWLSYCAATARNPHPAVVWLLRWYGLIFAQVFYVTSLTLLLVALDCNYFAVPADMQFYNRIFPDQQCWSMPHLVQVAVSVVCIIAFVFMAGAMLVSEMELDPLTHNYMAINNTRVEGFGFILITLATVASVMVTGVKVLAILYVLLFALLNFVTVKWIPFIHHALNYARCGAYAAVLYCSCLLVLLAFASGTSSGASLAHSITIAMWAGLAPAAALGAAACHLRLRFFSRHVILQFQNVVVGSGSKQTFGYKFTDAREVEIAARCARRWLDEDTVDPEAMQLCETIIKAGMVQLPNDALMIIIYSSFLIDVQGSYQSGYAQLQGAKRRQPGPLERFAIYQREQDHASRAMGAGGGAGTVDLVSYVEFQRSHRLVTRAHKDALIAIRTFWSLLLHASVSIVKLERAAARIEAAVKVAERTYRDVLSRHNQNARLVRLYGRFLESVKYDPWSASKWFSEADRLDEHNSHAKEAMQGGLELGMLPRDAAAGASRLLANADGVLHIFINAQGAVQLASPELTSLLGYAKNELKGKDVGIIMPPPFSERHTAYVRNYVQTGVANILDATTDSLALTKNRTVCPIKLTVTKVAGLSEDSVFLGVIEHAPTPPGEARMWLLGDGTVVAADERLCDWLGYTQADLVGQAAEACFVDRATVQGILAKFKAPPAGRDKPPPPPPERHEKERRSSIFLPADFTLPSRKGSTTGGASHAAAAGVLASGASITGGGAASPVGVQAAHGVGAQVRRPGALPDDLCAQAPRLGARGGGVGAPRPGGAPALPPRHRRPLQLLGVHAGGGRQGPRAARDGGAGGGAGPAAGGDHRGRHAAGASRAVQHAARPVVPHAVCVAAAGQRAGGAAAAALVPRRCGGVPGWLRPQPRAHQGAVPAACGAPAGVGRRQPRAHRAAAAHQRGAGPVGAAPAPDG